MAKASQRPTQGESFLHPSPSDVGSPRYLHIPNIEVNAAIVSVGLTLKGAMDTPKNPDDVGWYDLGPRPGEQGSAVLDGHLNWYYGKTGVFQHLDRLHKGDMLSVETDKGRFLTFVVRDIRIYSPYDYVPDIFQSSSGSHLNLVTCDGTWDSARKIYSKRLVIFTDAISKK